MSSINENINEQILKNLRAINISEKAMENAGARFPDDVVNIFQKTQDNSIASRSILFNTKIEKNDVFPKIIQIYISKR